MKFGVVVAFALFAACVTGMQVENRVRSSLTFEDILPREDGHRLFEFEDGTWAWVSEDEMFELIRADTHFVGVVEIEESTYTPPNKKPFPTEMKFREIVENLGDAISEENIASVIEKLSSWNNRYYSQQDGVDSANWIKETLEALAAESKIPMTVETVENKLHAPQPSVIVRFSAETESDEVVILGCHLDSINMYDGPTGRAPGADDNGSGSSLNIELARLISQSDEVVLQRALEIHWYAAEEVGLYGSRIVSKDYAKRKVNVIGMMQNDMTGFVDPAVGEEFGIMYDRGTVTKEARDFIRLVASEYTDVALYETYCGYGCSDHASWVKAGYDAGFLFETRMDGKFPLPNVHIHTDGDLLETISTAHIKNQGRAALGFALELAMNPE